MYTFSGAAWAEETAAEPASVGSAAARAKAKVEVASINNVLTLAFNLGAKTRSVNRENNVLFLPLPPDPLLLHHHPHPSFPDSFGKDGSSSCQKCDCIWKTNPARLSSRFLFLSFGTRRCVFPLRSAPLLLIISKDSLLAQICGSQSSVCFFLSFPGLVLEDSHQQIGRAHV